MGYSVVIGGVVQVPLASTSGWSDAKAWIDTLDAVEYLRLVQLAEHGWTHSLPQLRSQIIAALKDSPPNDPTVADTMSNLVETLRTAKGESIFVSDGTSADDGSTDDGWEVSEFDPSPDESGTLTLAIDVLGITRKTTSNGEQAPVVPNFDGLAAESLRILDGLLSQLTDAIAKMQPVDEVLREIDLLVAQADFASQIAGAVGLWHESGERLITLELPPNVFDDEPVGRVRFPWLEKAAQWLVDRNAASPNELDAMASNAKAKSSARWQAVKQLETLRSELVLGFVAGESSAEFSKRVAQLVDATKPQLETAFRTATHQAYTVGATTTLEKPPITKLFPAVEYFATLDNRVRDDHRILDHKTFDVGSDAYFIAKRALMDFNCRCVLVPIQRSKLAKKPLPETIGSLPAAVLAKYGS